MKKSGQVSWLAATTYSLRLPEAVAPVAVADFVPLTVAGQRWFRTIFPDRSGRCDTTRLSQCGGYGKGRPTGVSMRVAAAARLDNREPSAREPVYFRTWLPRVGGNGGGDRGGNGRNQLAVACGWRRSFTALVQGLTTIWLPRVGGDGDRGVAYIRSPRRVGKARPPLPVPPPRWGEGTHCEWGLGGRRV